MVGRWLSIGDRAVTAGPLRVVELLFPGDGGPGRFLEPAVLGRVVLVDPSCFPELPSIPLTSTISSSPASLDCSAAAESGDDSDGSCPAPGSLSCSLVVYECVSCRESLATAYVSGGGNPEGSHPSSLNDQSDGLRVRGIGGYEDVLR